eukprot:367020-Hanusia_phi.AAC.1
MVSRREGGSEGGGGKGRSRQVDGTRIVRGKGGDEHGKEVRGLEVLTSTQDGDPYRLWCRSHPSFRPLASALFPHRRPLRR